MDHSLGSRSTIIRYCHGAYGGSWDIIIKKGGPISIHVGFCEVWITRLIYIGRNIKVMSDPFLGEGGSKGALDLFTGTAKYSSALGA